MRPSTRPGSACGRFDAKTHDRHPTTSVSVLLRVCLGFALAFAGRGVLLAQGLPFHTETALTTAFEERGLRFSSTFASRDSISVVATPLAVLPFAPHQRLTTRVVVPLLYKRMTTTRTGGDTPYSDVGLGDVSVGAKWAFFVRDRFGGTTRLALAGDVSLPTGSTGARLVDGTEAPRPLQLGTGAVAAGATLVATVIRGQWGLSVDAGHRRHASGDGFRFGNETRYDLAFGLRLPAHVQTVRTRTWQFYLEWNGSIVGRSWSGGSEIDGSGGHVAFLSPAVQWVPHPQLLLEASMQIPVIQDLNGSQPEHDPRPSLGVRFLFF